MIAPANNEKAGAASTAAGPLDTEFVHPVFVDTPNQELSLEESSEFDVSAFVYSVTGQQTATAQITPDNDSKPTSSLEVWKAEEKLLSEDPVENICVLPSEAASAVEKMPNQSWQELVQSGLLGSVRWDEFILADTIDRHGICVPLDSVEVTSLRNECASLGYTKIPSSEFGEQLKLIARKNKFDSAQEWLSKLPIWDGTERVKHFLPKYLGTGLSPYFEAVARYLWTAMVARILEPACQVDMVPVIVGRQGLGKTSFLRVIAPNPTYCVEACLTDSPSQLARKLLGKTVVVWEELAGIKGRADADRVKTFITNPYVELSSFTKAGMDRFDRRFVICGTSNRKDFLRDITGNRRYLPFESWWIDLLELEKDKLQLWAEALEIVKARQLAGEPPVDFEDAERLAEAEFAEFMHQARWYGDPDLHRFLSNGRDKFSTSEALKAVSSSDFRKNDSNDMANTLRQLKYKYHGDRSVIPGRTVKVWHKPNLKVGSLVQSQNNTSMP